MALALLYGKSHPIEHTDRGGVIPATASVRLVDKYGTEISAPTVTIDSVSTTLQANSTASSFDLTDATGVVVGRDYAITDDGVTYRRTVAAVTSAGAVEPTAALPEDPQTGAAFVGLRMSATVPDSAIPVAKVGDGYRLEWSFTDAAGNEYTHSQDVSIVRWTWTPPVRPDDVAEYVAAAFPSMFEESREVWSGVADRVNRRISNDVEATGRRAYLYGDGDAFREAGYHAMRSALAELGYFPPGLDATTYRRDVERDYHTETRRVIGGLRSYDENNDGKPDQDSPRLWSVRVTL
jgi:hypothetical protein